MEVTRGFITIKTTNIRIKPTNLEIIGINVNNLVILKYLINDIPKYHQFSVSSSPCIAQPLSTILAAPSLGF
jgi:hypothetical protein